MTYLAFALKYRPQNFKQVVGQEHIVFSLQKAISAKRVHHAYLFSGPRGIGKTSLARILAKSLNCQKGPVPEPCLRCPSCIDIAKGKSLDIIEIDGASNRGIDEIRALRESVKLSPAASRFKVYIIDEVHMLTKEAFNALLKTLEEPPKHVKFIFATTDPHKVLPTILSRCQKFQFTLLSLSQIVKKLNKIVKSEKLKIEESFLYTIAQAAEGSIRDAESLLDQVAPVITSGEDIKDVFSFLGIIDESVLNTLIGFLSEADLINSLGFVDKLKKEGKDPGVFLDYLLKYLRNLLLAKINPEKFRKVAEISPQSRDFMVKVSSHFSLSKILQLIDFLIKAKEISRQINSAYIPLELALIKFLYKEGDFEIEKKQDNEVKKQRSKEVGRQRDKEAEKQRSKEVEKQRSKEVEKQRSKEVEEQKEGSIEEEKAGIQEDVFFEDSEEAADDILAQPVRIKWKDILAKIQKERMAIASHLSFAKVSFSSGKKVFITFPVEDKFHKEILDCEKSRRFIQDIIKEVVGKDVRVVFKIDGTRGDNSSEPKKDSSEIKVNDLEKERDDNFLNELLDTFDGKFQSND